MNERPVCAVASTNRGGDVAAGAGRRESITAAASAIVTSNLFTAAASPGCVESQPPDPSDRGSSPGPVPASRTGGPSAMSPASTCAVESPNRKRARSGWSTAIAGWSSAMASRYRCVAISMRAMLKRIDGIGRRLFGGLPVGRLGLVEPPVHFSELSEPAPGAGILRVDGQRPPIGVGCLVFLPLRSRGRRRSCSAPPPARCPSSARRRSARSAFAQSRCCAYSAMRLTCARSEAGVRGDGGFVLDDRAWHVALSLERQASLRV